MKNKYKWELLSKGKGEIRKSYLKKFYIDDNFFKRLILRIKKINNEVFVELKEDLYDNVYNYKVRTLKDAEEILKLIMDNDLSYDEIVRRMSNPKYYYSFDKLDDRYKYYKLFQKNKK